MSKVYRKKFAPAGANKSTLREVSAIFGHQQALINAINSLYCQGKFHFLKRIDSEAPNTTLTIGPISNAFFVIYLLKPCPGPTLITHWDSSEDTIPGSASTSAPALCSTLIKKFTVTPGQTINFTFTQTINLTETEAAVCGVLVFDDYSGNLIDESNIKISMGLCRRGEIITAGQIAAIRQAIEEYFEDYRNHRGRYFIGDQLDCFSYTHASDSMRCNVLDPGYNSYSATSIGLFFRPGCGIESDRLLKIRVKITCKKIDPADCWLQLLTSEYEGDVVALTASYAEYTQYVYVLLPENYSTDYVAKIDPMITASFNQIVKIKSILIDEIGVV